MALSGCWDRREPKNLALVQSVVYDLKENKNYNTIFELLKPAEGGEKSGGSESQIITVSSEGQSIPEAIKFEASSLEKYTFGGHNYVRFLTENFAKKDISPFFDFVLRDQSISLTPYIIVIKSNEPNKLYESSKGLSDTVGSYIESLSKSEPKAISRTVFISTLDFIKDVYADGKQPVAGVIEIIEDKSSVGEKKFKLFCEGLAAFKDNKLVGYLNGNETKNYNIITNNLKTAVISVPSRDNFTVSNINKAKTGVKIEENDGKVTISVQVKATLSIIQEGGFADITKSKELKKIEQAYNKKMSEEISMAIKKVQTEFKSDIFGFGRYFHMQHPKKWKEAKDKWDDNFSEAEIKVSVKTSITRSGLIKQPFRIEELG